MEQFCKKTLDKEFTNRFCELLERAILNKAKIKRKKIEDWKKNSAETALIDMDRIESTIQLKLDSETKGQIIKREVEIIEEIKQAADRVEIPKTF